MAFLWLSWNLNHYKSIWDQLRQSTPIEFLPQKVQNIWHHFVHVFSQFKRPKSNLMPLVRGLSCLSCVTLVVKAIVLLLWSLKHIKYGALDLKDAPSLLWLFEFSTKLWYEVLIKYIYLGIAYSYLYPLSHFT